MHVVPRQYTQFVCVAMKHRENQYAARLLAYLQTYANQYHNIVCT